MLRVGEDDPGILITKEGKERVLHTGILFDAIKKVHMESERCTHPPRTPPALHSSPLCGPSSELHVKDVGLFKACRSVHGKSISRSNTEEKCHRKIRSFDRQNLRPLRVLVHWDLEKCGTPRPKCSTPRTDSQSSRA